MCNRVKLSNTYIPTKSKWTPFPSRWKRSCVLSTNPNLTHVHRWRHAFWRPHPKLPVTGHLRYFGKGENLPLRMLQNWIYREAKMLLTRTWQFIRNHLKHHCAGISLWKLIPIMKAVLHGLSWKFSHEVKLMFNFLWTDALSYIVEWDTGFNHAFLCRRGPRKASPVFLRISEIFLSPEKKYQNDWINHDLLLFGNYFLCLHFEHQFLKDRSTVYLCQSSPLRENCVGSQKTLWYFSFEWIRFQKISFAAKK